MPSDPIQVAGDVLARWKSAPTGRRHDGVPAIRALEALLTHARTLEARLASLTSVSEEDVERVARQAMDETDGDEAWFDATPHNRTRVRSIVRAALTAFVSR